VTTSTRVRPHPDVLASQVDGELVLVHLGTDRILSLNQTAARIWELVCAGCDRPEMRRQMLAEFDVSGDELDRELERVFQTLQDNELLVPEATEVMDPISADEGDQP
jgi:hypothetical protein